MEIVPLLPQLHMLRFAVGQAYLWQDRESLTLIDTGIAGSAESILGAVRELGRDPGEIERVILTHYHADHIGSAAELAVRTGARIHAHRADAPVIRGDAPEPPPVLTEEEKPIFDAITPGVPPAPRCDVHVEIGADDVLGFGGDAVAVPVPGHTDGSLAIHLPQHRVLFTGDTVAEYGGNVILGVFNRDRSTAIESFRQLAELDADVACFGHGEPVLSDARAVLKSSAAVAV